MGRLLGVRIALDWSLIVIFLLVTFNLAAGVFPAWHPSWSPLLSWTVALAAALLFFVSILVHELSHAMVARAYGIPVRRITLFLLGGVADIEEEPDSPKVEALMAGIGPVTSIVIGVALSILAGAVTRVPMEPGTAEAPLQAMQRLGPAATLLTWLGTINVIVGVFNLIPAFPLDGGRVLRAALWAATRDLDRATRWASGVGQAFGWLLVVTGIAMVFGVSVPVFGRGVVGGIWLAFIGWFISTAAATSYRELVVRHLLEDVPVARLMRRKLPAALDATRPVSALVDATMSTGERLFLVVRDGQPTGLVSAGDVRKISRAEWDSTDVGHISTGLQERPSLSPEDDAYDAMRRLGRDATDELPVMRDGELVGIVRTQDIARWIELHRDLPGRGTPSSPRRALSS